MLGIIGAMDVEIELLKQAMGFSASKQLEGSFMKSLDDALDASGQAPFEDEVEGDAAPEHGRIHRYGGLTFYEGAIGTTPCVVVQCGIGMVNAAACTQALIDHFDVSGIINTGVGGSLNPAIDICDIVIGTGAVNHRMDARILGYEEGQTPGMEKVFSCDEALGNAVGIAAAHVGVITHRGIVGSGDVFVADPDLKAHIHAEFDAICCEMEGAAIAQVCAVNGVPCVIVRAISDKADGSEFMDYPVFEKKAANVCAALIKDLAENVLPVTRS